MPHLRLLVTTEFPRKRPRPAKAALPQERPHGDADRAPHRQTDDVRGYSLDEVIADGIFSTYI